MAKLFTSAAAKLGEITQFAVLKHSGLKAAGIDSPYVGWITQSPNQQISTVWRLPY